MVLYDEDTDVDKVVETEVDFEEVIEVVGDDERVNDKVLLIVADTDVVTEIDPVVLGVEVSDRESEVDTDDETVEVCVLEGEVILHLSNVPSR